ncbi:MAG: hypothetical protein IJ306_07225 [Oscillospiraceae bacterium]|nr:hypothetical protein [Oscillospiraceae bacterium]
MKDDVFSAIELFKNICSNLSDTDTRKSAIKKHNSAMLQLRAYSDKLCSNEDFSELVFNELLLDENKRVRQSAAANALRHNICVDKSKNVLETIAKEGGLSGFEAEMTLKVWRGEVHDSHL